MKTAAHIFKGIIIPLLFLYPAAEVGAEETKPFVPHVTGLLKTRFENDTQTGNIRFNVNNARLGIGGFNTTAAGTFRYRFQAELNTEGKFNILDAYAAYSAGAFEISLGQQQYSFGTELNRGPRFNYFASPSFLASYTGSYYHTAAESQDDKTGNLGARDIGLIGKYRHRSEVPINALAGLVNGSGINNPAWSKRLNFVARLWIEPAPALAGMGGAVSFYTGRTPFGDPIRMTGGELRYVSDRWRIEGEYARRNLVQDGKADNLDLAALHAIYFKPLKHWGAVKFLAPMARWDYGRNITLKDAAGELVHFDANRATAGLTVGFAQTLLKCELRLNYEHYFLSRETAAVQDNPAFHNKFIVEFFLAF